MLSVLSNIERREIIISDKAFSENKKYNCLRFQDNNKVFNCITSYNEEIKSNIICDFIDIYTDIYHRKSSSGNSLNKPKFYFFYIKTINTTGDGMYLDIYNVFKDNLTTSDIISEPLYSCNFYDNYIVNQHIHCATLSFMPNAISSLIEKNQSDPLSLIKFFYGNSFFSNFR